MAPFTIDRAGRRPTALVGMVLLFTIDIIAGSLAFKMNDSKSYGLGVVTLSFIFNFF